jgi:hypothetical protein
MSDFDPELIYRQLVGLGENWADAESAASLFEETRKSVLAQLVNTATGNSVSANEYLALAHPEYREHIQGMVEARRQANLARVRYDSGKVLSEMRRSQESTRRAEMTLR